MALNASDGQQERPRGKIQAPKRETIRCQPGAATHLPNRRYRSKTVTMLSSLLCPVNRMSQQLEAANRLIQRLGVRSTANQLEPWRVAAGSTFQTSRGGGPPVRSGGHSDPLLILRNLIEFGPSAVSTAGNGVLESSVKRVPVRIRTSPTFRIFQKALTEKNGLSGALA